MSILTNQSDALVKVQSMNAGQLKEIFGEFSPVAGNVVGALYNSDTDGMKNALLHSNPAGIMTGLKIAAVLSGAKGATLVVDCPVNEQELVGNANMVGLTLTFEQASIVNKLNHKDDALYCFDELAAFASRLLGESVGCMVSVDDGAPVVCEPDTKVTSLIPEGVKGIIADHRFFSAEKLGDLTVGELKSQSGVIHTIDSAQCVINLLDQEIIKLRGKSCGKCVYCREGLYQISQTVHELTVGHAKPQDFELAKEIGSAMTVSCNCSLGDMAGFPVLTVAEGFDKETEAHVKRKECPTGVCLALTQIYVDPAKCVGCGACVQACPQNCIEGKEGYISMIDSFDCTRCGKCLEVCENGAIVKTSGRLPKLPTKLTRAKGVKRDAAATEEKTERTGLKRKRNFARSAAPAAAASSPEPREAPEQTASAAPVAGTPETVDGANTTVKTVGKRKRVYAKAKGPTN